MAKICEDYKEWVEEKIEEPIKKKKKGARERCKRKKCKKWCLCCNKWKCWIETFFYWVIEWIVRIVGKWFVYTVCRIVSALITLFYTLIVYGVGIFRVVFWLSCLAFGKRDVKELSMKQLQVEVVIIDKSTEANSIPEADIDKWIGYADRIFREEARIKVKRRGKIRREVSDSLYEIDATSLGAKIGEWLKSIFLLTGRGSPRYLTIYAVGKIFGTGGGLHLPLYGSVFIVEGIEDTSLAHEIGHSLLAIWNTYHNKNKDHLMYTPPDERQTAANWPTEVPKISRSERCAMRQSRWLDMSWKDWVKTLGGWIALVAGGYSLYVLL